MTKKKLEVDAITNELEGASLFFSRPTGAKFESTTPPPDLSPKPKILKVSQNPKNKSPMTKVTTPVNRDTVVSQYQETLIETVRKKVRELGKEAATYRFTQEEKRALSDMIYTYKNTGLKTSENEITRIAINFIFEDYKENGEESVLDKVLKALNA